MNTNALFKIGYGLYILSANENNKPNQSDNGILFVIIITVVIIGVVLTVIIIAKRKANKTAIPYLIIACP